MIWHVISLVISHTRTHARTHSILLTQWMWFVADCFALCNVLPLYHRVWLVRCYSLDRTFAVSLDYVVRSLSIFHHVYGIRLPLCPANVCAHEMQTDESLCLHRCCTWFPCVEWTSVGLNRPFPVIEHRLVCVIYNWNELTNEQMNKWTNDIQLAFIRLTFVLCSEGISPSHQYFHLK